LKSDATRLHLPIASWPTALQALWEPYGCIVSMGYKHFHAWKLDAIALRVRF
jgi:hypothetical protein